MLGLKITSQEEGRPLFGFAVVLGEFGREAGFEVRRQRLQIADSPHAFGLRKRATHG